MIIDMTVSSMEQKLTKKLAKKQTEYKPRLKGDWFHLDSTLNVNTSSDYFGEISCVADFLHNAPVAFSSNLLNFGSMSGITFSTNPIYWCTSKVD